MDPTTLFSNLVSALAWPIATVILCLLFRSELRSLLGRLARAKGKDWELEFGKAMEQELTTQVSSRVTRADASKPLNPGMAIAYLTHEKLLSPEDGELLSKLRVWRNRVAHDIEAVDPKTATAYCDLAEAMLSRFRRK